MDEGSRAEVPLGAPGSSVKGNVVGAGVGRSAGRCPPAIPRPSLWSGQFEGPQTDVAFVTRSADSSEKSPRSQGARGIIPLLA